MNGACKEAWGGCFLQRMRGNFTERYSAIGAFERGASNMAAAMNRQRVNLCESTQ